MVVADDLRPEQLGVRAGQRTRVRTIDALLPILAEYPADARVLYEVGGAYDTAGREQTAGSFYEQALQAGLSGDLLRRYYVQYGSTLRNLGELARSEEVLERADKISRTRHRWRCSKQSPFMLPAASMRLSLHCSKWLLRVSSHQILNGISLPSAATPPTSGPSRPPRSQRSSTTHVSRTPTDTPQRRRHGAALLGRRVAFAPPVRNSRSGASYTTTI